MTQHNKLTINKSPVNIEYAENPVDDLEDIFMTVKSIIWMLVIIALLILGWLALSWEVVIVN